MASGGIGNQSPATIFQARLATTNGVGNTLSLVRYAGEKIVVSGVPVVVPQTGIVLDVADNLINSAGADSGAPGAVNTLYYVYVSNRRSPFAPEKIKLSVTAPSLLNGVKYLGLTGNAINWRFVGWVRLNATPQFESTDKRRFIINYYNRTLLPLFTCPGYVNDNAFTRYAFGVGNYAPIHASVDDHLFFISNGEDSIVYAAHASVDNNVGATQPTWFLAIGEDSDTQPAVSTLSAFSFDSNAYNQSESCGRSSLLSEGFHTISMLMAVQSSAINVYADGVRLGAAADPPLSYMEASVLG